MTIGKTIGVNIRCLEGVSEEELARIPIVRGSMAGKQARPPCVGNAAEADQAFANAHFPSTRATRLAPPGTFSGRLSRA